MRSESLHEVKTAFEEWRSNKRHVREPIPEALLEKARQVAQRHGPAAVARATKVAPSRLKADHRVHRGETGAPASRVPAFSRVQIAAPATTPAPFAEIEMPTGLKLRLFTQTESALALLASLCCPVGAR